MPLLVITDWDNGPMGGGFFIHFPRHRNVYYDGGGMFDLIGKKPKTKEEEERIVELVALILLMNCC